MKNDSSPAEETIAEGQTIELHTRYGSVSRGKCWGKYFANKTAPTGDFEWVSKNQGTLYLTGPGYYIIGSSDGYSRKSQSSFYLAPAVVSVEQK